MRYLIRLRCQYGEARANAYLGAVGKKRGNEAETLLRNEYLDQLFLGNKGRFGVWIEQPKMEQPCK